MTTYRVNQKGDGDMSVVIIPAYKPDETLIEITDKLWAYGVRLSWWMMEVAKNIKRFLIMSEMYVLFSGILKTEERVLRLKQP